MSLLPKSLPPTKGKRLTLPLLPNWLTSLNFSCSSFLLGHQRKFLKNLGSMVKTLMARLKRWQNLANLYTLKSHPRVSEIFLKSRKISLNC